MHEGHTIPTVPDVPPMGNSQRDTLERITRQLEHLTLNLMQRPAPPRDHNNRGQRRKNQELQCYNCAEYGHGAYQCPYPRREPGGPMPLPRGMFPRPPAFRPPMAPPAMIPPVPQMIGPKPIPPLQPNPVPQAAPIPPVEARVVNIIELGKIPREGPRADGVKFEVMPAVKRTRADKGREGEEEEEEPREHRESHKEEGESSKRPRKAKKPRRKITLRDFPLRRGHESYDLIEDLGVKKPNITYPQLLELSPSLRKPVVKISKYKDH